MSKSKQQQTVTIDGVEHELDNFTQDQKMLLEHCLDLDRKLASCSFQMDQLRVGKEAFLSMLKKSLENGHSSPPLDS